MSDQAILFGPHAAIVGIFTPPADGVSAVDTAVIMLNAGLVHHVGPHRQHVNLARAFARLGLASLRMDFSSIGDSPVCRQEVDADELAVLEIQSAIDELNARGYQRIVLFGICSGAKYALRLVARDARVSGLILVNQAVNEVAPEVVSGASAQYYMRRSVFNPQAWLNLLTGRVDYKALFQSLTGAVVNKLSGKKGGMDKAALLGLLQRELQPAVTRGAQSLVVLSDRAAQFVQMIGDDLHSLENDGLIQFEVFTEADHLFTALHEQSLLNDCVCTWLSAFARPQMATSEVASSRETVTI